MIKTMIKHAGGGAAVALIFYMLMDCILYEIGYDCRVRLKVEPDCCFCGKVQNATPTYFTDDTLKLIHYDEEDNITVIMTHPTTNTSDSFYRLPKCEKGVFRKAEEAPVSWGCVKTQPNSAWAFSPRRGRNNTSIKCCCSCYLGQTSCRNSFMDPKISLANSLSYKQILEVVHFYSPFVKSFLVGYFFIDLILEVLVIIVEHPWSNVDFTYNGRYDDCFLDAFEDFMEFQYEVVIGEIAWASSFFIA